MAATPDVASKYSVPDTRCLVPGSLSKVFGAWYLAGNKYLVPSIGRLRPWVLGAAAGMRYFPEINCSKHRKQIGSLPEAILPFWASSCPGAQIKGL